MTAFQTLTATVAAVPHHLCVSRDESTAPDPRPLRQPWAPNWGKNRLAQQHANVSARRAVAESGRRESQADKSDSRDLVLAIMRSLDRHPDSAVVPSGDRFHADKIPQQTVEQQRCPPVAVEIRRLAATRGHRRS